MSSAREVHVRDHTTRRRVSVVVGALALCGAMFAVAAPTASAAVATELTPGQQQLYATQFWGETTFCAGNYTLEPGQMHVVNRFGTGDGPFVDVPPGTWQCASGWYWGVPAMVVNSGSATLLVTVTP